MLAKCSWIFLLFLLRYLWTALIPRHSKVGEILALGCCNASTQIIRSGHRIDTVWLGDVCLSVRQLTFLSGFLRSNPIPDNQGGVREQLPTETNNASKPLWEDTHTLTSYRAEEGKKKLLVCNQQPEPILKAKHKVGCVSLQIISEGVGFCCRPLSYLVRKVVLDNSSSSNLSQTK